MGKKSNAGQGAPFGLGGLVNAGAGKHAHKETGRTKSGKKVSGFGSTSSRAHRDYKRKGGK